MACFSFTTEQRAALADIIGRGMSDVQFDNGGDLDDAIGSFMEELEAGTGSIEITVMADAVQYGSATLIEDEQDDDRADRCEEEAKVKASAYALQEHQR